MSVVRAAALHFVAEARSMLRASRARIGLGIGARSLRAVLVERGTIRWAVEGNLDEGESLARAIATLLRSAPVPKWPRPSLTAAIGPAHAQVKRLSGLPSVADRRTATQLVRESAARFFLRNETPPVTTDVDVDPAGELWAAAFDREAVDAIEDACRAIGLRVSAVAPTVAVLGGALEGDSYLWQDGEMSVTVSFDHGRLTGARRVLVGSAPAEEMTMRPVPSLAALGDRAWRFADAYGAAVLPSTFSLAYRSGREISGGGVVSVTRLKVASVAAGAGLIAALAAPGAASERAARVASDELAVLGPRRAEAAEAERELSQVTGALRQLAAFDARRRSMILLLADLTRSLPEGSAIVALRVDSAGGSIVALGPRGASVLGALDRVPGLSAPEIMGPITREPIGAEELERITVRFRFAPPAASSADAAAAGASER